MAESMSEEARDELLVFESIYPDYLSFRQDNLLQLSIPVDVPGSRVDIEAPDDVEHDTHSMSIDHLPPTLLAVILSHTYPASSPPLIHSLRTEPDWLCPSLCALLRDKLLAAWKPHENVLCVWADYIHNAEFLPRNVHGVPSFSHPSPQAIVPRLLKYNQRCIDLEFSAQSFSCPICLLPTKGSKSLSLSCSHVVCCSCLHDFWSLCVTEGEVERVGCPDPECVKNGSLATRDEVTQVVTRELLDRWTWLRNKLQVERDPSTVYCPNAVCQAPVSAPMSSLGDDSGWSRLRTCSNCKFAFCSMCRRTWHGPHTPCVASATATFILEYMELNEDDPKRALLERRFGRKLLQKLVEKYKEEEENRKWFELSTTACPGCKIKVEKTLGCNHMTCIKCKQHFCYRCGMKLNAQNPYPHFSTPGLACYNRLFDLESTPSEELEWIPMEFVDAL